jgi:hypothetical protein
MRLHRNKFPVSYWILVGNLHRVSSLRRTPLPPPSHPPPPLPSFKQKSQKNVFNAPSSLWTVETFITLQITASIFTITHLLIIHQDFSILVALSCSVYQYFYQCTARVAYPRFTFVWPWIVTNFFVIIPNICTDFTNLFRHETLHVSDSSSVHHKEFIHCTLSNGICHTGL